MLKRTILTGFIIFIVWSLIDFVVHSHLLQATYEATADLWRPFEDMNIPFMYLTSFIFSLTIAALYTYFVSPKSLSTGIKFGLVLGFGFAVISAFGSYAYMPIPLNLAVSWFFTNWLEVTVAGAIAGFMIKH